MSRRYCGQVRIEIGQKRTVEGWNVTAHIGSQKMMMTMPDQPGYAAIITEGLLHDAIARSAAKVLMAIGEHESALSIDASGNPIVSRKKA